MIIKHEEHKTFLKYAKEGNLEQVKHFITERNFLQKVKDQENKHSVPYIAASNGHLDIVKYLLEECTFDPNAPDLQDRTLFHYAALGGHTHVIKYLVEHMNVDPLIRDKANSTALHLACDHRKYDVVKYLIENGHVSAVHYKDTSKSDPVRYIVENGDLDILKYIAKKFPSYGLDAPQSRGYTLLHLAVYYSHLDIVKYLIDEKKVRTDTLNEDGMNILDMAADNGDLEMVKYIYERVFNNMFNYEKRRMAMKALKFASGTSNINIIKYFIEDKKTEFNTDDPEVLDCIFEATKSEIDRAIVYFVEELKIDTSIVNIDNMTILECACKSGSIQTMRYLFEVAGLKPEGDEKERVKLLHSAISHGYLQIVRYLVEVQNIDPNIQLDTGKNALHAAIEVGYHDICKYLIFKQNLDVTVKNSRSQTSLHIAVEKGFTSIIILIIQRYKEMYNLNKENERRFDYESGSEDETDSTKEKFNGEWYKNNDFNGVDNETPLHVAVKFGFNVSVKLLVRSKILDIHAKSGPKNYSMLHIAAEYGFVKIIEFLVHRTDISLYETCSDGDNCLHIATRRGFKSIVKYLVEDLKMNKNKMNNLNQTPLSIATSLTFKEIIPILQTPDVVS